MSFCVLRSDVNWLSPAQPWCRQEAVKLSSCREARDRSSRVKSNSGRVPNKALLSSKDCRLAIWFQPPPTSSLIPKVSSKLLLEPTLLHPLAREQPPR